MTARTRWLIVRFVPDLDRQEPRNVGVILHTPYGRRVRFRGIDATTGAVVPDQARWARNVTTWQTWVRHWSERAFDERIRFDALLSDDPASHFRVVPGGRLDVSSADPDDVIDELYRRLVAPPLTTYERIDFHHEAQAALCRAGLHDDRQFRPDGIEMPLGPRRGRFRFPYGWVGARTTVGYELVELDADSLDAATLRVSLLPDEVRAVVLTATDPSAAVDRSALHSLTRRAEVIHLATVRPSELAAVFRGGEQPAPHTPTES